MELIDDQGRIFGTINIIDALAVLLILTVVAAGTAFVLQSGEQDTAGIDANATDLNHQPATRYATLDLGTQPSYVAERITVGDNATLPDGNLTVTDVYRTSTKNGVHVWARVELDGQLVEQQTTSQFRFAGSHLDLGRKLAVATEEYRVNGTVRDLAKQNPSLPGGTVNVILRTTTSAEKAVEIHENDTYSVANGTVATVESVDVYPTENPNRKRVVLGVTMKTLATDGQQQFLGHPVQIGRTLPFKTDAYSINGNVVHRGSLTQPGERTTTTVTVKLTGLAPDIADGISMGMVERINNRVNARIVDTRVEAATVIVQSQNGTIHEREHPQKKDVYLTVELDTRRTDAGLYFHGTQLQEGNDLVLDLGSITVHGQVIDLQAEG